MQKSIINNTTDRINERDWGYWIVLNDNSLDYRVKKLVVNPNSELSYQRHKHRAEHWVVVEGIATVNIKLDDSLVDTEDLKRILSTGESCYVPPYAWHQLTNNHDTMKLVIIETWIKTSRKTKDILGEIDIERIVGLNAPSNLKKSKKKGANKRPPK